MARKTAYYATKIAKSGLARGIARGFARGFPGGPLVCNLFFAQSLSINKKKMLISSFNVFDACCSFFNIFIFYDYCPFIEAQFT